MKKILFSFTATLALTSSAFAGDYTHNTLISFGQQKFDSQSLASLEISYNTYANKDYKQGLVKHFSIYGAGKTDIDTGFYTTDYLGARIEFMLGYGIYLNDFVNLPFESSINPLAGANYTAQGANVNYIDYFGNKIKVHDESYGTWTLKAGANWHNVINNKFVINADMYFGKYVGGDKEITDAKSSEFSTSAFLGYQFSRYVIGAKLGYENSAIGKGVNYYISFGSYY